MEYRRRMLCRMPTQTMLCPWINRTVSGGWENIPKCNVQKASESHLPVDSVSIHGYGPKSGQQRLESLRIFIWQWCVGEIKLHYLFIRLLLRGTHSRRVCMTDMGWKHGYKDQCVEQSFIEE